MPDVGFDPVPFIEAAELIRNKPALLQEVFARLIPEIKARAFTIAGVASADVLQEVRNRIADLPEGADWNKVKKDVLAKISPWLVTADEPEERAKQEAAARRRAELLVRTHSFQAYQAAHWQALTETKAAFPFWRYVTAGDDKVRESHAALNGLVLPADSPFWRDHFPPWDWGCRCDVVGLSPEDVDRIRAEDAKRNPEDRLLVDGNRLKRLEESGQLFRGPLQLIDPNDPERKRPMLDKNGSPVVLPARDWDLNSPARSGLKNAWSWTPGDLRIPLDALRTRYDEKVWGEFEKAMSKAELDGVSVLEWLNGMRLLSPLAPGRVPYDDPKIVGSLVGLERAAAQRIRAAEDAIRNLPNEWALIFDRNGKVIARAEGDASSVLISYADLKKARRSVVSHNHPSGGSFSRDDLHRMISFGIGELRAVTADGVYVLRAKEGVISSKAMDNLLKAWDRLMDGLEAAEDKAAFAHLKWKQIAQENGLDYAFLMR